LGKLLRSEEVREDAGVPEVWPFAGCSLRVGFGSLFF